METRLCPTCKSLNPADAKRCMICGGVLDPVEDFPPPGMPTRRLDRPSYDQPVNPTPPPDVPDRPKETPKRETGSLSKLRSILSSDTGPDGLDALRASGLLPDTPDGTNVERPGRAEAFTVQGTAEASPALPEWLRSAEFGRTEPTGEAVPLAEGAEGDARPADLPDWVKRLRSTSPEEPLGSQSVPHDEPEAEASRDVPLPSRSMQPPGTFLPISIPDAGIVSALKSYLVGLRSPRRRPEDRSGRLSRLSWGAIGLALIGLIAVLSWSGTAVAGLPQASGSQLEAIGNFIDQLAPESVILVGVDYDLPLAGELENASLPVIVDLMSKQVSLVFVPTRPVGSAMAENLAGLALKWQPDYPSSKLHFADYLPGGAVGLAYFALDPRAALPAGPESTLLWAAPDLGTIHQVGEFSQVLIITDSLESGRDWVEQVGPFLGSVPMDVIASSQAAPLLRPYQASGQIRGMVSGITTAADYERMTLMTTSNQLLLRAYRGGLAFMIVLVASSLVLATFVPERWFNRRKGKGKHAVA